MFATHQGPSLREASFLVATGFFFPPSHTAHRFAVALLDSKRQDLCYACCGLLTNLATDPRLRSALRDEGVVQK